MDYHLVKCYSADMKSSQTRRRFLLANTLGTLGYASCFIQWLWLVVTLLAPLLMSDAVQPFILPDKNPQPVTDPGAGAALPEWAQLIIMAVAVIFACGVCLYALWVLPRTVGKAGNTITRTATATTLKQVQRRHPLSARQKTRLIDRISWTTKLVLVITPVVFLAIPVDPILGLDHTIAVIAGLFFASWSVWWFSWQFIVVRLMKLPTHKVW